TACSRATRSRPDNGSDCPPVRAPRAAASPPRAASPTSSESAIRSRRLPSFSRYRSRRSSPGTAWPRTTSCRARSSPSESLAATVERPPKRCGQRQPVGARSPRGECAELPDLRYTSPLECSWRSSSMGILAGKRAFIVGVATDRSIAWGIAKALHREGAELAFSYPNDRMKERVVPLAQSLGSNLTLPLDVTADEQLDGAFDVLKREWGQLDIVIHAVAFAPTEAIKGSFTANTSREAFRIAHDVSSYSFTALARGAQPLMAQRQGALLTLSYLGAVRSIPSYNVMGLAKASLEANVRFLAADLGPGGTRVNAISAGPIKTLAAAGIGGFRRMLAHVAQVAPLRRNVTLDDVGNAAAFLCSDM